MELIVYALAVMVVFMWFRSNKKALGLILIGLLASGIVFFGSSKYFDRIESTSKSNI